MLRFFEENVSTMSFTFTFIVLLNAILGYFNEYEALTNHVLLTLAVIILILWAVNYVISLVPFTSTKVYYLVNFVSVLTVFYIIVLSRDLLSWSIGEVVSNGLIFLVLYFINIHRKNREVEHLANEINKKLSELS